jgi:cyclophilin family peptidyl-prolyl cis-trans isomerase
MKVQTIIFLIALVLVVGIAGKYTLTGNVIGGDEYTFILNIVNIIGGEEMTKVKLTTNQGDIVINLYSDMPITTGNFEKLVKDGFYDGVIFHRIIPNFMIQGGDPQGTGMGGPGYNIEDEFTHSGGNRNSRGTISMANSGPNTGGSQFFINLVDNNFLDDKHPAFGMVVEGMDVIDKIAAVQTGAQDRPVKDVKITKAEII